jgi:large subunit ribosomal protein L13Ae
LTNFAARPANSNRLEERRKVKSAAYYERKKAARRQLVHAKKSAPVAAQTKSQLAQYGF